MYDLRQFEEKHINMLGAYLGTDCTSMVWFRQVRHLLQFEIKFLCEAFQPNFKRRKYLICIYPIFTQPSLLLGRKYTLSKVPSAISYFSIPICPNFGHNRSCYWILTLSSLNSKQTLTRVRARHFCWNCRFVLSFSRSCAQPPVNYCNTLHFYIISQNSRPKKIENGKGNASSKC